MNNAHVDGNDEKHDVVRDIVPKDNQASISELFKSLNYSYTQ